MIYQDINFKICLSLFGWKVNILPKMHIVHWQEYFPGLDLTLDTIPDNGVILVVTNAGSKQLHLEKSIREKSLEKNVKIYFSFYPFCREDCEDSLPVYKRLSGGRMFNNSDFSSEMFFRTVVTTV